MTERKSLTEELLELNSDKEHIIEVVRENRRVQLEDPNLSDIYKEAVIKVTDQVLSDLLPKDKK